MGQPKDRIILALDVPDAASAHLLAGQVDGRVGKLKIGMQLFYAKSGGHSLLEGLCEVAQETEIMLDLKLCDIPNTMREAIKSVACLKPRYLTVHASSGPDHLKACVDMAGEFGIGVLAITVLTTISQEDFYASGHTALIGDVVLKRAEFAAETGCVGIVCSGLELAMLAKRGVPTSLKRIVPGIRPQWAVAGDQKRIATPKFALEAGADELVIGRPIRTPPTDVGSPVHALALIHDEIQAVS